MACLALAGAMLAGFGTSAARAESAPSATSSSPSPRPTGPASGGGLDPMGQLSLGSSKDPILISADQLDFDWQNNKVVYRGKVHATQGELVIESDTLTINFLRPDAKGSGAKDGGERSQAKGGAGEKKEPPAAEKGASGEGAPKRSPTLRDVVAEGHVVITQKGRRATGGIAVFSQQMRQLVLGGDPVLRDGPNEITGDRIVVYVDEGRSVVESSGSKRVSAVLYPGSEKGLGGESKPEAKTSREGAR